jgi:hypothetical protein
VTLADLLPLAVARCGPRASVRLTITSGGSYIAAAFRSITSGEGVEQYTCAVERTEERALEALADKLRGHA